MRWEGGGEHAVASPRAVTSYHNHTAPFHRPLGCARRHAGQGQPLGGGGGDRGRQAPSRSHPRCPRNRRITNTQAR